MLALNSVNYSIWVQILSFSLFLMTDANLSTRLPQPRVMPCIVYIYLMIYLFVEQNDLQFASLSGRVTILSSTTASGSCGDVFLFRASSECRVPSACSSSNSTHKRCQGDHHCSRGFRQMWKMLKNPVEHPPDCDPQRQMPPYLFLNISCKPVLPSMEHPCSCMRAHSLRQIPLCPIFQLLKYWLIP